MLGRKTKKDPYCGFSTVSNQACHSISQRRQRDQGKKGAHKFPLLRPFFRAKVFQNFSEHSKLKISFYLPIASCFSRLLSQKWGKVSQNISKMQAERQNKYRFFSMSPLGVCNWAVFPPKMSHIRGRCTGENTSTEKQKAITIGDRRRRNIQTKASDTLKKNQFVSSCQQIEETNLYQFFVTAYWQHRRCIKTVRLVNSASKRWLYFF